ncbi:MAG: hypothetical protein BGO01_17615 [Armatimonadetes bacterium 55-13]|nr:DUF485 domain-containing protein [Armatimonadota bacterium]OJU63961.1 MAG: hypothetical protein BGO01_17615 [Armatimonadetes bacterium 55-13]
MNDPHEITHLSEEEQERLLGTVMREQMGLSLKVAAVFILLLVGLPLGNFYLPDLMGSKVGGLTLTWLILGILFYPLTWVLSYVFVKQSESIEHRHEGEF